MKPRLLIGKEAGVLGDGQRDRDGLPPVVLAGCRWGSRRWSQGLMVFRTARARMAAGKLKRVARIRLVLWSVFSHWRGSACRADLDVVAATRLGGRGISQHGHDHTGGQYEPESAV